MLRLSDTVDQRSDEYRGPSGDPWKGEGSKSEAGRGGRWAVGRRRGAVWCSGAGELASSASGGSAQIPLVDCGQRPLVETTCYIEALLLREALAVRG